MNIIKLQQEMLKNKLKGVKVYISEVEDNCYISDGFAIFKYKAENNMLKIDSKVDLEKIFNYNYDKDPITRTETILESKGRKLRKYYNIENDEEIYIDERLIKYIDLDSCYFFGSKRHDPIYIYDAKTSEQIAFVLPVRLEDY